MMYLCCGLLITSGESRSGARYENFRLITQKEAQQLLRYYISSLGSSLHFFLALIVNF